MAEEDLNSSLSTVSKGVKILDKLGVFGAGGDAALGTGNIFTTSHAMQGGSTGYAASVPGQAGTSFSAAGLSSALASAGFAAFAGFIASKIYTSFTEDNPALVFQGGTGSSKIPIVQGAGENEASSNATIRTSDPTWTSDKFEFGIAIKDIPEGENIAKMVGEYFDGVFTKMQANTDVDLNSIIKSGIDLTDWENGGVEAMVGGVIDKVASGIQTGQPLVPYYASKAGANGQLVDGLEDYDPEYERRQTLSGRVGEDAVSALDMTGRDGFDARNNGQIKQRLTYTPIETLDGDANFTMPDISDLSITDTPDGSITDTDGTVFNNDGTVTSVDGGTVDTTNPSFDVNQDLWNQFLSRASTDLEGLIKDNADFTRNEATQVVGDTQAANDANTAVLNNLRNQLVNENGTFTPTQTAWGNYQPGTNFINAKSLMSIADKVKDNALSTSNAKYSTIADRSPSTGALQFLASLQDISETDKAFILDKYRADKGLEATQYRVDSDEPSTLSNIVSSINAGKGILDLGTTIYDILT